MVLLDDVVQVLRLTKFNIKAGVSIDALDNCGIGAALVDGDFLGQTMQIDGTL